MKGREFPYRKSFLCNFEINQASVNTLLTASLTNDVHKWRRMCEVNIWIIARSILNPRWMKKKTVENFLVSYFKVLHADSYVCVVNVNLSLYGCGGYRENPLSGASSFVFHLPTLKKLSGTTENCTGGSRAPNSWESAQKSPGNINKITFRYGFWWCTGLVRNDKRLKWIITTGFLVLGAWRNFQDNVKNDYNSKSVSIHAESY